MNTNTNTNGATATVNKSDFVRKYAPNVSAAKIVSEAKAIGISLSPAYVHSIRAQARNAGRGGKKVAPAPAARIGRSSPAPAALAPLGGGGDVKNALMKLALHHGIDSVEKTLSSIRTQHFG